jgi:hypothetical protein
LANSDVVKQERKTVQTTPDVHAGASAAKVYLDDNGNPMPATDNAPRIDPKSGKRIDLSAGLVPKRPGQLDYDALAKKYGGTSERPDFIPYDPYAAYALPNSSHVNRGGIETINWKNGYAVASIETEDGQTLNPTAAPSAWLYLFIVLLPLFGFLIPWGVVRAIGWVGAGFVAKSV